MHIWTPLLAIAWLSKYLCAKNAAGPSEAGLLYSSSVGAICPTGHNSDSSQVRFNGGDRCSCDVECVCVLTSGAGQRALMTWS